MPRYRQGVISKNDKFQTTGFHSSPRLNQFTSSNNGYVPLWTDHRVFVEAKPNRYSLVNLDLNPIEQLWDEALAMHQGSFSVTSESSTVSGCSPLRMGFDSQEWYATLRAFKSTSLWCIYCCRREPGPFFLTNLIQVNWIGRDRDIQSPVKNLSFLKMPPCLYTGVQHERI